MRYVGDSNFKSTLEKMVTKLLSGESLQNINFRIVQGVYFLAQTWTIETDHRVVINKKLGRMMHTDRGLKRAYAVLAHEIGHIFFHNYFLEKGALANDTSAFSVMAEKEADKHAVRLLKKLYPNPKEILLDQIAYALKISLKYAKTEEKKGLAKTFAKERKLSLNELG